MRLKNVLNGIRLLSSVIVLTSLVSCTSAPITIATSGRPAMAEGIGLSRDKGLFALPEPSIAFTDPFTDGLQAHWNSPLNQARIVTFKTAKLNGKDAMVWINEKEQDVKYDTETAIGSKPFSVKGYFQLDLDFSALSTVGKVLRNFIIHYANYDFKICWFRGGEAAPFKEDYFDCETSPDGYVFNHHAFDVPAGADTATLHFGFGSPNFQKGQLFAVADLKVLGYKDGGKVKASACFETAPMRLNGRDFSYEGSVPDGTSAAFSFAYAPDDNGAPGIWTEWSEPINNVGLLNPPNNAAWVKCRTTLKSDGTAAASIRSITIDNICDGNWKSLAVPGVLDIVRTSVSPAKADAPLVATITHAAEINWKNSTLQLDDKPVASLKKHRTGSTTVLTITPSTVFADGFHKLTAHLETIDGAVLDSPVVFYVGKHPAGTPKVTLRYDGMMIVDGKPFFPIGLYVLKKFDGNNNDFDTMFRQLRGAGFNFGREVGNFSTANAAREFAEAAERNDYKIFLTAGFKNCNTQDLPSIANGVAEIMDCKSILMWYIGDDTASHNKPNELKYKNDTVKAVDPYRITVQADGVGVTVHTRYERYVNGTDVFHPELYPVKRKNSEANHANCVLQVIEEMDACMGDIRRNATAPKSIQALVQNFTTRDKEKGWTWPTEKEVRAMSYATVIRGATGMLWYMYGPLSAHLGVGTDPERWEKQCKLASEFNALYDILTAEPIPQPSAPAIVQGPALYSNKRPPVYSLLKTNGKRTVLMTVNASVNDVTARFVLKGFTKAKELFADGKTFAITENSTLDVNYSRHDVRIFELE